MGIGSYVYPLVAFGIAGMGAWKSVIRKLRFAGSARVGKIDFRKAGSSGWETYVFRLSRSRVKGRAGHLRVVSEEYYNTSMVYIPKRVSLRTVYICQKNIDLGGQSSERLAGFTMNLCGHIPDGCMDDNGDGTGTVKVEHRFRTFCRRYGIPMRRVEEAMRDLRREFYRRMVMDGTLPEEYLV